MKDVIEEPIVNEMQNYLLTKPAFLSDKQTRELLLKLQQLVPYNEEILNQGKDDNKKIKK